MSQTQTPEKVLPMGDKSKNVFWASLPMRAESMRMSQFNNPHYADALKKDWTNSFNQELKIIGKSKMNLILFWWGLQGFGKSWSLLRTVEKFLGYQYPNHDKDTILSEILTIDHCFYTITELLKNLRNAGEFESRVLDEQVQIAGAGSAIEKRAMQNVEMTVRAQRLSFFFASPAFVPHNCHYFFEVWQAGSLKPWDWDVPMEEQWKYTKNIIYDQKGFMLGYMITGTPRDMEFIGKYNKKKDEFINRVKAQKSGMRFTIIEDQAKDILSSDSFLKDYAVAKTRDLKTFMVTKEMGGFMAGTMEVRQIVSVIDYMIATNPEYQQKLGEWGLMNPKQRASGWKA